MRRAVNKFTYKLIAPGWYCRRAHKYCFKAQLPESFGHFQNTGILIRVASHPVNNIMHEIHTTPYLQWILECNQKFRNNNDRSKYPNEDLLPEHPYLVV